WHCPCSSSFDHPQAPCQTESNSRMKLKLLLAWTVVLCCVTSVLPLLALPAGIGVGLGTGLGTGLLAPIAGLGLSGLASLGILGEIFTSWQLMVMLFTFCRMRLKTTTLAGWLLLLALMSGQVGEALIAIPIATIGAGGLGALGGLGGLGAGLIGPLLGLKGAGLASVGILGAVKLGLLALKGGGGGGCGGCGG
ncbi:unnamed protein product, partial [Meganyctiphanes norvegica]